MIFRPVPSNGIETTPAPGFRRAEGTRLRGSAGVGRLLQGVRRALARLASGYLTAMHREALSRGGSPPAAPRHTID